MKIHESNRLMNLSVFEDNLYIQGYESIAGVDEVGRGALAGPIVAAAVILPRESYFIERIDDSKKLSDKSRREIYEKILNNCISYGIGKICSRTIDKIMLGKANKEVFKKALSNLKTIPDIIITDALTFDSEIPVIPIINGDELSVSICAASVIAKVRRDDIMSRFDKIYPEYGFCRNKGYGTKEHIDAIKRFGMCPLHRRSFNIKHVRQDRFF